MKTLVTTFSFLLTSSAFAAVVPSGSVTIDPAKSSVEFTAIGTPSALKILGKAQGPSGTLTTKNENLQGELSIDLDTFDTGIQLRNRHMKEKYLETGKFPKAILKLESFPLKAEMGSQTYTAEGIPFTGTLSLHGVEKPISGLASAVREGSVAKSVATFKIKLSDFGISTPSFAGVTVAENVDVKVSLQGDGVAAAPEAPAASTAKPSAAAPAKPAAKKK